MYQTVATSAQLWSSEMHLVLGQQRLALRLAGGRLGAQVLDAAVLRHQRSLQPLHLRHTLDIYSMFVSFMRFDIAATLRARKAERQAVDCSDAGN